jgi:hypothetical protein
MSKTIAAVLGKACEDDFLRAWPDSLVDYLNRSFASDAEWVRAYRDRYRNSAASLFRGDRQILGLLRRQQARVRALVDSLLQSAQPKRVAEALNEELERVRVTPSLWLRSEMGLKAGPGGSPFALRWIGWNRQLPHAQQALVDLARLYGSAQWQSLRKCGNCGTYFLAGFYRRKKYCSNRCMWLAGQRRHRSKQTESERETRRAWERERKRERRRLE